MNQINLLALNKEYLLKLEEGMEKVGLPKIADLANRKFVFTYFFPDNSVGGVVSGLVYGICSCSEKKITLVTTPIPTTSYDDPSPPSIQISLKDGSTEIWFPKKKQGIMDNGLETFEGVFTLL